MENTETREQTEEVKYSEYSLHNINNISSLEELSKYNKQILKHASMITKHNKEKAKDLVQEFYLKMFDYFEKNPNKKINGGFIANTLRNRYIDEVRFMKRYDFGVGDKDSVETYLIEMEEAEPYELTKEDSMLDLLSEIIENDLSGEEKLIIELTYDMNLSELSRQTGISYSNLRYSYLKAKTKIEQKLKENRF